MNIVPSIALILSLSLASILLTDIFYNYAISGFHGKSFILDLMYNNNIYFAFIGALSILIYIILSREVKYVRSNRFEELNKAQLLFNTVISAMIVILTFTIFSPINMFFENTMSYLVFMFVMMMFSMGSILMFLEIYHKLTNFQDFGSKILRIVLIFSGIAFLSNFIHLVIFEKIGLKSDCSFAICYEVNNINIILFLVLAYAVYTVLFWLHSDIFVGIIKIIFTVFAFSANVIITFFLSKWLPIDWALVYLMFSYVYYIHQMIKMSCTKQSETIIKHGSLWQF